MSQRNKKSASVELSESDEEWRRCRKKIPGAIPGPILASKNATRSNAAGATRNGMRPNRETFATMTSKEQLLVRAHQQEKATLKDSLRRSNDQKATLEDSLRRSNDEKAKLKKESLRRRDDDFDVLQALFLRYMKANLAEQLEIAREAERLFPDAGFLASIHGCN